MPRCPPPISSSIVSPHDAVSAARRHAQKPSFEVAGRRGGPENLGAGRARRALIGRRPRRCPWRRKLSCRCASLSGGAACPYLSCSADPPDGRGQGPPALSGSPVCAVAGQRCSTRSAPTARPHLQPRLVLSSSQSRRPLHCQRLASPLNWRRPLCSEMRFVAAFLQSVNHGRAPHCTTSPAFSSTSCSAPSGPAPASSFPCPVYQIYRCHCCFCCCRRPPASRSSVALVSPLCRPPSVSWRFDRAHPTATPSPFCVSISLCRSVKASEISFCVPLLFWR